jgi:hypothetical protein
MPDQDGRALDLRSLLAAVEVAAPVAAVDVFAAELAGRLGAKEVSFLISDFSGGALVRMSHHHAGGAGRWQGADTAETVPLSGTPYEQVIRTQRLQTHSEEAGTRLLAPVTARGDVIGVLEMLLPVDADADTIDDVAAAAHALGYVVIVNRRFTDLFEWGQRSQPFSLAAEIQRRLLPTSLTCEAGQFTVAGALEPAGNVGGDTFDYALDRHTLHVSLTDAGAGRRRQPLTGMCARQPAQAVRHHRPRPGLRHPPDARRGTRPCTLIGGRTADPRSTRCRRSTGR